MVWSHLTLGRAAKRERYRRMRGRNESDGRGVEDGGGERRRQKKERRGGWVTKRGKGKK